MGPVLFPFIACRCSFLPLVVISEVKVLFPTILNFKSAVYQNLNLRIWSLYFECYVLLSARPGIMNQVTVLLLGNVESDGVGREQMDNELEMWVVMAI